jgi:peptide-methionine (R)-S-oxide reductase
MGAQGEAPGQALNSGSVWNLSKGDETMKAAAGSILMLLAAIALMTGLGHSPAVSAQMDTVSIYSVETGKYSDLPVVEKTASEWRKALSAEQFRILRQDGTDRPFTGKLWDNKRTGVYRCAGCGTDLFHSDTKFKSGTGWPSFYEPVAPENIREVEDNSFFMRRIEIECARCGGHQGHVFNDGPPPTGLRYCINTASLTFVETSGDVSPMDPGGMK